MTILIDEAIDLSETLTVALVGTPFVYGSLAGSIRYWSSRLDGQLWLITPDERMIQALVTATSMIENLRFVGRKTDLTQAGEFPRNGSTIVPIGIQNATYELAMALLKNVDIETEQRSMYITRTEFGQIATYYDYSLKGPEHIVAGIPSLNAWKLLRPFLSPNLTLNLRRES